MPGGNHRRTGIVPPIMTLGERVAREKGIYPEAKRGWDIPFRIYYSKHWLEGYLIASDLKLMIGLPGAFLVYWDERFQGTICWKIDGWEMPGIDPDLVVALGEWIVAYYQ
jgi:hypothetical protein